MDRVIPSPQSPAQVLNARQEKFAVAYVNGGCQNGAGAAREAGSKSPKEYAKRCLCVPKVLKRIEELTKLRTEEFQKKNAEAEGRMAERGITRDAVMRRLWELASLAPDDTNGNITGQVKAAGELSEILGMKVRRTADLTPDFQNRSEQELDFFAKNGYFPESVDASKSRPN